MAPLVIFAKMWGHFVVYHDLGYPMEGFKSNNNKKIDKKYVNPFSDIQKFVLKDITLKTISKIIAIENVFLESEDNSFKDLYFNYIHEIYFESEDKEIEENSSYNNDEKRIFIERKSKNNSIISTEKYINDCGDYTHLPQLDNNKEQLFRITSLISKKDILCILENKETGEPIAIIPGSKDLAIIYTQKKSNTALYLRNKNLFNCAYYEDSLSPNKYLFKYFIDKPEKQYDTLVNSIFNDSNAKKSFLEVKDIIQKNEEYNESLLKHSQTIEDLEFNVYYNLQEILGYTLDDDSNLLPIAQLTKSYSNANQNVAKKLPSIISNIIMSNLKQTIEEDKDFKPSIILKEELPTNAAEILFDKVIELKKEVCVDLSKEIQQNLRKSSDKEIHLRSIENVVRRLIEENVGKTKTEAIDKFLAKEFLQSEEALSEVENIDKSCFKVWETSLSKIGLGSFNEIISNYKLDFTSIDHGIFSSLIFLKSLKVYDKIFESKKESAFYKFLSLFHEGNSHAGSIYLKSENIFFSETVGLSILLHNLYPSSFKSSVHKKYRNQISSNPFNFLAILTDTFQKWDRDKLIKSSKEIDVDLISGSDFNLEIKDDILYVSLLTNHPSVKDIEDSLKNNLKEFLHNGDKMIRFAIKQK